MKYIWMSMLILLLVGCEEKKEQSIQEHAAAQTYVIIDEANVLQDDKKLIKMYREYNENLLDKYDIDFRVVTTVSKENIDMFANKQFAKLQKESRSKSGKALLLVINTLQDKVRLEVSMALEPVYTDAFISYIERKGFVPYFREHKMSDGVYAATELVYDRAVEASRGKEFVSPMTSRSIGAGAKTKANIGIADPNAKRGAQVAASTTDTPMDIMKRYLNVLKMHNKNPNLDIFTDGTKRFFTKWTVTDINQNHEANSISSCVPSYKILYDTGKTHAVVAAYPYEKYRTCSPYFFKKEQGKWKLDIATMAQILRFNAQMQFHFDMKKRLQKEGKYYAFAFDGFTFDRYGYPHIPNSKRKVPKGARWGFNSSASWYEPGPSRSEVKKHPKKYIKAMISYVFEGSRAETRLGLKGGDYIRDMEINGKLYKNVLNDDFLRLIVEAKKGSVVKLFVKNRNRKLLKREGIAP